MAKVSLRKCKCYWCNETIEKDEPRVKQNITEKQEKNFHPFCVEPFLKDKELKDIEVQKWNNVYEYVKVEIMGYTKEKQLTPVMRTKLQTLRNGSFVRKGVTMSKDGYDYDVILTTFKAKKIEVERALFGKTFEDDNHKFNYIMVIITNSINDVAKRLENAKRQKDKEEELREVVKETKDVKEVYKDYKEIQSRKQKKNQVANLLSDLL